MTKISRMGAAVAAATLALGMLATAPAFAGDAYAEASVEQSTAIEDARIFLTEYGVDEGTQEDLFAEFLAGGRWDSFSSTSTPLNVENTVEDGYNKTVSFYSDGSVAVSRIELPSALETPGIGARSAPNGCTVGSGGARTNCNVDMWVGVISMGFKANYNLTSNTVSSVWGGSWTIGGACSTSQSYLGRPNGYTGNLTVAAQMCGIGYSTSFNLAVTVSGGTATESWW